MSNDEDDTLEKRLDDITIFRYTDAQAVDDGVLIPFLVNEQDTRHRITANAFHALKQHYRQNGCANYDDPAFQRFFFHELLPLISFARDAYRHAGILRTYYSFRVIHEQQDETLWYLPNEIGGVTMMLPEDY